MGGKKNVLFYPTTGLYSEPKGKGRNNSTISNVMTGDRDRVKLS